MSVPVLCSLCGNVDWKPETRHSGVCENCVGDFMANFDTLQLKAGIFIRESKKEVA